LIYARALTQVDAELDHIDALSDANRQLSDPSGAVFSPAYLRKKAHLEELAAQAAGLDLSTVRSDALERRATLVRKSTGLAQRRRQLEEAGGYLEAWCRTIQSQALTSVLPAIRWPEASRLVSEAPALAVALANRIAAADATVVIAESWSQYKPWMEFETQVSGQLGRPLIAVTPPGQRSLPPEVRLVSHRSCSWNIAEIVQTVISAVDDIRDPKATWGV
jgi:hypothetical protein